MSLTKLGKGGRAFGYGWIHSKTAQFVAGEGSACQKNIIIAYFNKNKVRTRVLDAIFYGFDGIV